MGRQGGHINPAALSAFVSIWTAEPGRSKSSLAREAELSHAGHLWLLTSGQRLGSDPELRRKLAAALSIPVEAITCRCGRPEGRCLSAGGDA
jgi:hypothetical protein